MDGSVFLHDVLISANVRDTKFQVLLDAYDEQQIFACKPERNGEVISAINSRLNELKDRPSGILLLKSLLHQCSDRVFVEYCLSWSTQCLKALASSQSEDDTYEMLRMLIDMSHNFQELTKQITGKIIPKVLEHILKSKRSVAALRCLEVVLHRYPGPCKSKLNNVRMFLLGFLDEEEKSLVEHASRCMCYLPLLEVIGHNDGTTWTRVLTDLCATASTLIYDLYDGVHEAATPSCLAELSVGHQLKNLRAENPFAAQYLRATRFMNILTFIEGMLLGDLQYVKAVRADLLVALSYRALAVNCKMVSRGKNMEHAALMCVLPRIHVAVFNFLQTYFSCCPAGLLKYGPLFCKLALQTLKWTSGSNGYGVERSYRHLREAAYNFLENWVLRAKAASCVELLAEDLIAQMLQDIYQKKESVTLQFQEKGKDTPKQLLPQVRQRLADEKVNAGPCMAALQALSAIVLTSGALLGASLHMRLQEMAVSLLLEIQRASGPEAVPVPYSTAGCRLQLYRLLLALTLHPHPRWPPPTQFALAAFPCGQHDSSLEVASFCMEALACTRQMVHPSQSTHQFPISLEEMRTSVGLSNIPPVQGITLNVLNGQQSENEDAEMVLVSDSEKSQQNPRFNDNLQRKKASKSPVLDKISKKTPHTSETESSLNGIDSSINTSNSSTQSSKKARHSFSEGVSERNKENTPNSDKSLIKKQHLQFTVEELPSANNWKTPRNSGQEWEVTELTKKQKGKKDAKFVERNEISIGTKRRLESPSPENNKTIKLDEPSAERKELDGSFIDGSSNKSPDSDTAEPLQVVNQELDKTSEKDSDDECMIVENVRIDEILKEGKTDDGKSTLDLSVEIENDKEDQTENGKSRESDNDKEDQIENEKSRESDNDKEDQKENEKSRESDNDKEDHEEKKEEIKNKEVQEVMEKEQGEDIAKKDVPEVPPSIKTETNRYNLRRERINSPAKVVSALVLESKSNDGQENDKCPSNSTQDKSLSASVIPENSSRSVSDPASNKRAEKGKVPKAGSPVVEFVPSSDSEPEQQKRASGCYRRITRSLAKHVSTPHKSLEHGIAIEELPCSQESLTAEMLSEISRLEESAVAAEDPSVELAESDESTHLVLRLESDHESIDIEDVTSDAKENQDSADKEKKGEMVVSGRARSSSGVLKSPASKNLKDSVASDREMEEDSEGMEAVAHSPDIAVEEAAPPTEKDGTAKKLTTEEDGSGSETSEEDILKTFKDVVSPKSA